MLRTFIPGATIGCEDMNEVLVSDVPFVINRRGSMEGLFTTSGPKVDGICMTRTKWIFRVRDCTMVKVKGGRFDQRETNLRDSVPLEEGTDRPVLNL